MTVQQWLDQATKQLSDAGIGTARLDSLVLLEDCLQLDRAQLLAKPELEIKVEQLVLLRAQIKRRVQHEPLAYIRGKTEFYGREFFIDKHVLEPRPESETMIDLLKLSVQDLHGDDGIAIIDVGTGSGALAITAKLELPEAEVSAVDIDPNCLDAARRNTKSHHAEIELTQGDLLQPYTLNPTPSPLILLCNLPYVPDNFHINPAAGAEPRVAIFGGSDGLNLYRHMFTQIAEANWRPQIIFTESLPPQHEKLAEIARAAGFRLTKTEDFVQQFEKY